MFLDNCIAVAGADVPSMDCDFTIIYDNEPRNRELLKQIEKNIDKGYNICIWPENIGSKDINEMVIEGLEVQKIVDNNIYQGLRAKVRITEWRKC